MIKVLNKNKPEKKIYRQACDECQVELEFEYEDTYEGAFGARYVKCPECNREVWVESIDSLHLTEKNLQFPRHFECMDEVDVSNDEIQEWARNCLKIAKESKEPCGYFVHQGTGNATVVLLVYEDGYEFVVAKNYYSLTIPR